MKETTKQLFDFIAASPSAWHAADTAARRLEAAGYIELFEGEAWGLAAKGKYFVRRNGSSLIAFKLPVADFRSYMIMAAHSDSPGFMLKQSPEDSAAGVYTRLGVEKYGGMIMSSWLDRPLSVAGRVTLKQDGRICQRLLNIDEDLLLIPSLAIHMDRQANENKSYNPSLDMLPLFGGTGSGQRFAKRIAEAAHCAAEEVLSAELFVYVRSPGTVWGADGEFISAPRLDDLQCVYACMEGLLNSRDNESAQLLCLFDNEEVGSATKHGADSSFLSDTMRRIWQALGRDSSAYYAALAESFMVSADNAHALHPNHPEFADKNDRPQMNGGIVIKHNAGQRYTSDAVTAAVFAEICAEAKVPVQHYSNRADIPGGSTLGNISSSHVSIDTVDVGLAQLAMHSAYETAGERDTELLIKAAAEFFSSSLRKGPEGIEIKYAKIEQGS